MSLEERDWRAERVLVQGPKVSRSFEDRAAAAQPAAAKSMANEQDYHKLSFLTQCLEVRSDREHGTEQALRARRPRDACCTAADYVSVNFLDQRVVHSIKRCTPHSSQCTLLLLHACKQA